MSVNQDQYITTVAQCFLRDVEADAIVMKSKTLVNSNIAFNVEETEIRGGEFSRLLYNFNHSRTGEITLEDARYEPAIISLNLGKTIQNELSNVYKFEEEVELDGNGDGEVTDETPLSGAKAYVQLPDRSIVTKSFSNGNEFLVGGTYANETVRVTYQYEDTVDVVTVDGESFPKTYELVMEVKVWDADGLKEKVQWIFPQFKPSGNFEMPSAHDSPITSSMNGKIMDADGIYGHKKVIAVGAAAAGYHAITADVGKLELTTDEDHTLTVYGLRGGVYAPVVLDNSDCTFDSSETTVATVDAGGKIEYVGDGTTYITIDYNDLIDIVEVECSSE